MQMDLFPPLHDRELWRKSGVDTRARLLIARLRWLESSERRVRHQLTELMGVDWEAGQS